MNSPQKVTSTLNCSTSKESHCFSKSQRFPGPRSYTAHCNTNTFDKNSDFDVTVRKGKGREAFNFGSKVGRFNFSYVPKTNQRVGPSNYPQHDAFQNKHPQIRSSSMYTFGVSRVNMKKEFVEESQMKSKQGPGPDTYKDPPKFGSMAPRAGIRQKLNRYGDAAENYSPFYF